MLFFFWVDMEFNKYKMCNTKHYPITNSQLVGFIYLYLKAYRFRY